MQFTRVLISVVFALQVTAFDNTRFDNVRLVLFHVRPRYLTLYVQPFTGRCVRLRYYRCCCLAHGIV